MDNLTAAREQMALSLTFHIIFAVLGVGLPWLLLFVEHRAIVTGDPVWKALARRWSKALAILFGIGAVSGTVLSVEFGLLWPAFMERFGAAFGVSFSLEAFAFFAEAIFLGLYLYGWDRLSPRAHWWCGVPIAIGGTLSALFVTTANAWMNTPVGIVTADGKVVESEPFAPFQAPTAWPQITHLLIAAAMCTGFTVAAVYAVGMLRGKRGKYYQRGLTVGLAVGLIFTPIQLLVGDWAIRAVEKNQPTKMAAIEALPHSGDNAPLSLGGVYDEETGELKGGIEIPSGLSLLLGGSPNTHVTGLDKTPKEDQPPVTTTHLAFDLMVGIGLGLFALTGWALWRHRRAAGTWRMRADNDESWTKVFTSRWFLRALAISGPAAMTALIAGWIVTEVGRQPWIVYQLMRTEDAVSTAPGLEVWLYVTIVIYTALSITLISVLRRLARSPIAGLDAQGNPLEEKAEVAA